MEQRVASQPHNEAFLLHEESLRLKKRIESGIEAADENGRKTFSPEARMRMKDALDLAIELHHDEESRDDGSPTVDHIFRVAGRVVNSFGVTDPDVIVAALLHDSVEEQRGKLTAKWWNDRIEQKTAAFLYLESRFGARAAAIVWALTKPDKEDYANLKDRDRDYLAQLKKDIQNPCTFYVKLADFYDNVFSLKGAGSLERQKQRARKYQKVFSLFIARLQKEDIVIPPSGEFRNGKKSIIEKLRDAEGIAVGILLQ